MYKRIGKSYNMSLSERMIYEDKIREYILTFIKNNYPKYYYKFKRVPITITNNMVTKNKYITYGMLARYADGFYRLSFNSIGLKPSIYLDEFEKYLDEVVLHECLHLLCYLQGKDYKDGSEYFENMLLKHGSKSSARTVNNKAEPINVARGLFGYKCECSLLLKANNDSVCPKCQKEGCPLGFYVTQAD